MPKSFRVRASLVEAPLLSASTNDRCGFRVDRLRPAIPFRFFHDTSTPLRLPLRASATPSLCYGSWRFIASPVTNYLHTSIPTLPPTPPVMPTVSGPFPFQCVPKLPLAIPTRKDRHPHSVLQSAHCRHPPPSSHPIRGLMNARRLARGTLSFLALSGSMDLSPRAVI